MKKSVINLTQSGNEKGNRDGTLRNNCGMPAKWNDE